MQPQDKIFVAGHKGLVGSAIVAALRGKGYANIITADHSAVDLTRQDQVEAFFSRHRPAYVFLAAAKVGGILANNTYKAEFIYDNLAIAANVIHTAHKTGVKKLLNLGSSCIYPKLAPQPLTEDSLLTGPLESTNEPYAIAKIAAIKLCRYYNEQYGTDYISLMPTNLFGPNDNYNLETAHVLPSLLRKFHLAHLLSLNAFDLIKKDIEKTPLGFGLGKGLDTSDPAALEKALASIGLFRGRVVLWGTGEPFREFLHADDMADAAVYFMRYHTHKTMGEFVNIGVGKDIRIRELAALMKQITGFTGAIVQDTSKPDGTPKKLLDVSRAAKLGWSPSISLEEGIRGTYEVYKASHGA